MTLTTPFVPANLDASSWSNIKPLFESLLVRQVDSAQAFEQWLIDRSELGAACSEAQANLYISMTCNTDDAARSAAYTKFVQEVSPELRRAGFALDGRQVELHSKFSLDQHRYEVLERDTRADVEIFRDENVPLMTELETLSQEHQTITGAMTTQFDGQERTMPQMARYMEVSDRAVRESAWRAIHERRLQDKHKLDEIFTKQVHLRDKVAKNAGFSDYVGYAFASMRRFDYTAAHCQTFHNAVEKLVVPLKRKLDAQRAAALKVDTLRPWDLAVDVQGRQPLRPFTDGRELMAKTVAAFDRLDPRLGQMLRELGDGANTDGAAGEGGMASLDLDSRKGKAPGGYQYMRDRRRVPFIFMNAAGLHRDVETMVHEAGHAFHSMLCRDEPLLHYRHAPIEFCEVASMSMELLTMPYWNGSNQSFYPNTSDADRARRGQLEGSVILLAWIATIDAFQHWIYQNPAHTSDQRLAAWLALDHRFGHAVSWDGLEEEHRWAWQRQPHLYGSPFYYIEYGIAQLGALQLWRISLEKGQEHAIDLYTNAMKLGGSRPLPELFEAAGLRFDFGEATIASVVERVEKELAKLPA
jgi:oligoendopeptidase F